MKRLLFVAGCMLLLLPAVDSFDAQNSKPFNSIAVAGRNIPGGAPCDCGAPACACDPGELPGQGLVSSNDDEAAKPEPESLPIDAGGGLFVLLVAVGLALRMRELL